MQRTHFPDTVARGRDYYTPYRSLLPKGVEQLIVAGRHYSATAQAQKISREIPPCMSMGQSAGVAAAIAVDGSIKLRDVPVQQNCQKVRAQGGDPGDRPSVNARVLGCDWGCRLVAASKPLRSGQGRTIAVVKILLVCLASILLRVRLRAIAAKF
jgi:FAD dependent oxidoreductase